MPYKITKGCHSLTNRLCHLLSGHIIIVQQTYSYVGVRVHGTQGTTIQFDVTMDLVKLNATQRVLPWLDILNTMIEFMFTHHPTRFSVPYLIMSYTCYHSRKSFFYFLYNP